MNTGWYQLRYCTSVVWPLPIGQRVWPPHIDNGAWPLPVPISHRVWPALPLSNKVWPLPISHRVWTQPIGKRVEPLPIGKREWPVPIDQSLWTLPIGQRLRHAAVSEGQVKSQKGPPRSWQQTLTSTTQTTSEVLAKILTANTNVAQR